MTKPYTHYEFLEACQETGCPICRIGAQAVWKQMKGFFHEYVNDKGIRASLAKSIGFCGEHTRLLLSHKIADGLGASIIYEHLVKVVLREFPNSNAKDLRRKIASLVSASEGRGKCLACERRDDSVNYTLSQIAGALDNSVLTSALESSDGFCLIHLAQLLSLLQQPTQLDFVLNLTKSKLSARQAEMAEVIRKNDHHFQSEIITEAEALAWKKAMTLLSGISITPTGEKHG